MNITMLKCPSCGSGVVKNIFYSKSNCPVLNNVVYRTKKEASTCAVGNIELVMCLECSFIFNYSFNEKLISYRQGYDNARNFSGVYEDYLEGLIGICSKGINKKTKIIEIGCGKGEFLRGLCRKTGAQGFGFDTVYKEQGSLGNNIVFFREQFNPLKCRGKFDVLILRHVLEHISKPYHFLKAILDNGILSAHAKIWIEVPDFQWISDNGVFYDITYEHCSYFSKQALSNLLISLGLTVTNARNTFAGQYILLKAEYNLAKKTKWKTSAGIFPVSNLIARINNNRRIYNNLMKKAKNICIWGASGKGVIFLSELSDEALKKVKYVVDINPQKHKKFLPVSAKMVTPPEILRKVNSEFAILVMNTIYKKEIKKRLEEMRINARIYTIYN